MTWVTLPRHQESVKRPELKANTCCRQCGETNAFRSHVLWLCSENLQFGGNVQVAIGKILVYAAPRPCLEVYFGYLIGYTVLRKEKRPFQRDGVTLNQPTQDEWLKLCDTEQ